MTERDFVWGVSIAGHQNEGNNVDSDIWTLENVTPTLFRERSGIANDHWNRWEDDLDLVAALGLTAFRFSVEWARIEPTRGMIHGDALDHYERVVDGCLARGLAPLVTYNHFSAPTWFSAAGSWLAPDAADLFAAQCERVTARFGDRIHSAVTINEPNLEQLLQVRRRLPPFVEGLKAEMLRSAARVAGGERFYASNVIPAERQDDFQYALTTAHRTAVAAIKACRADLPVGVSIAICDDLAIPGGEEERDATRSVVYDHWLRVARDDDFIGVQNYEQVVHGPEGVVTPEGPLNGMGTAIAPESLAGAVRYAHEVSRVPVLVTEHGIQTDDDTQRAAFIPGALQSLDTEVARGTPVLGYLHWTLMDNFEWIFGYGPRLGLVSVDRATLARTRKPSADVYRAEVRARRERIRLH